MKLDLSKLPAAAIFSEAARRRSAMRGDRIGGRPRVSGPRCACGTYTASTATKRNHKCEHPRDGNGSCNRGCEL